MTNEELEIMINEFVDGELDKSKEGYLFTQLSKNDCLREYFKKCGIIKNEFQKSNEKFPFSFDAKILNSLREADIKTTPHYSQNYIQKYLVYLLVIVMVAISVYFIKESQINSKQLERTVMQVENQEKMIKLLINSIPSAEIKSTREESIIITANKM
ncbi:MAG: hypothetical protein WC055_09530 [Melioribacteraceae bacterium]